VFFFIIIGGIIFLIYKEFTKRYSKHRERRYFPADIKEDTKRKQHHKCAICKRGTGIWDFDHKDGNRSNNRPSNCQALCPTCHAKKTRGLETRKEVSLVMARNSWCNIISSFPILSRHYLKNKHDEIDN
jgi:hypothetical protein